MGNTAAFVYIMFLVACFGGVLMIIANAIGNVIDKNKLK